MQDINHICFVCGKEFDYAPYYVRSGRVMKPVCCTHCLNTFYDMDI